MVTELFKLTLAFRGLSDEDADDGDVSTLDDADEKLDDEDDGADEAASPAEEAPSDGGIEE